MIFNRIEAKFRAKTSIRQAQPGVMKVTLVFLLLTTVLSTVVNYLVTEPSDIFWELVGYGYEIEEILDYLQLEYVLSRYISQAALAGLVSLVLSVYSTVMDFGYISYSLRLSRNEGPGLSHIFDGFLKLLRVLWMSILKGIFMALWTLLGLIPAVILLVVGLLTEMDLYAVIGGYIFLLILGVISAMIAGYRYCLAEYFLLDDPSRTALQCISLSKNAMKGWKMERFTLDMSFLGWALCGSILVLGLSNIWYPAGVIGTLAFNAWYLPYRCVTEANFYNCISGRTDPFRQGSDWEERMKDLQDSFDKPEF